MAMLGTSRQEGVNKHLNPQEKLCFCGGFYFQNIEELLFKMKKMFIYLFLLNILFAQQELKIEGYDHMPLHTKLLGEIWVIKKIKSSTRQ